MSFLKKTKLIIIGIWVIITIILLLVGFGIYSNRDAKSSFTPKQDAYLEKLRGEFDGFLAQNEKVKILTLEVMNALFDMSDESAFNRKSQQLLPEVQLLQNKLTDVRSQIAESKLVFLEEKSVGRIFEVLGEIYQFRYEYNQKVIEFANLGTTIDFNNELQRKTLWVIIGELEEMEKQLPSLKTKLVGALEVVDQRLADKLSEYPFLWK